MTYSVFSGTLNPTQCWWWCVCVSLRHLCTLFGCHTECSIAGNVWLLQGVQVSSRRDAVRRRVARSTNAGHHGTHGPGRPQELPPSTSSLGRGRSTHGLHVSCSSAVSQLTAVPWHIAVQHADIAAPSHLGRMHDTVVS